MADLKSKSCSGQTEHLDGGGGIGGGVESAKKYHQGSATPLSVKKVSRLIEG